MIKPAPPSDRAAGGPAIPASQTCAKCGAEFRWKPSEPAVKTSPLIAQLIKAGKGCDCGYGME
jgi:hypothetical protein